MLANSLTGEETDPTPTDGQTRSDGREGRKEGGLHNDGEEGKRREGRGRKAISALSKSNGRERCSYPMRQSLEISYQLHIQPFEGFFQKMFFFLSCMQQWLESFPNCFLFL